MGGQNSALRSVCWLLLGEGRNAGGRRVSRGVTQERGSSGVWRRRWVLQGQMGMSRTQKELTFLGSALSLESGSLISHPSSAGHVAVRRPGLGLEFLLRDLDRKSVV